MGETGQGKKYYTKPWDEGKRRLPKELESMEGLVKEEHPQIQRRYAFEIKIFAFHEMDRGETQQEVWGDKKKKKKQTTAKVHNLKKGMS